MLFGPARFPTSAKPLIEPTAPACRRSFRMVEATSSHVRAALLINVLFLECVANRTAAVLVV